MDKKLAVVTGGAGFIGSHLCERLVKEGYTVISLDNYFTGSKDNHVSGVEYREGHTKDIAKLIPEDPDIIYHLGEYSRVEQSVFEPDVVFDLNSIGTIGVLEYWRLKRCKLLYAGSSTKFGDSTSPYSLSKAQNTELVKRYSEWYDLEYAITYFYNVYGPRERAGTYGTVIEIFKRMKIAGQTLTVTSPGTQVRNFTHIDDIVDGLIVVGERGVGDEFGLGADCTFSILDIARLYGADIVLMPPRKGNRMQAGLITDRSKALGWQPKRKLEDYILQSISGVTLTGTEHRVIVYITELSEGPAERAFIKVAEAMPHVFFNVITTKNTLTSVPSNVEVHETGGAWYSKYLLPITGYHRSRKIKNSGPVAFSWSILGSYGTIAGVLMRKRHNIPLLITLAGQDFSKLNELERLALSGILKRANQVYGNAGVPDSHLAELANHKLKRRSLGDGDAFANQIRFMYTQVVEEAGKDILK